jgi:1-acyl-sn-glycerol-3-phosphate acyltransferase
MNDPLPSEAKPPAERGATARGGIACVVRYVWRVPLLLWHLLIDLPLAALLLTPLTARLRLAGEPLDHRVIRLWAAALVWICGFRLRRFGAPLSGAALFVANHVTWADIIVLNSQRMMGFVAKREIAAWPVVGWMAARAETIFHHRGSTASLSGVLHEMLARLRSGRAVAVFPEGRTGSGHEVGPFHARIFLAAVETGAPVQPVAIRYGSRGEAQTRVAFQRGEHFVGNFMRLLGEAPRRVDVMFLEPIVSDVTAARRDIAGLARTRIVQAMQT